MKSTLKCITLTTVYYGVWTVSCLKGREDQRLLSLYSNVQCIFYQHSFLLFHAHQRTWQYITLPLYSLLAATFSSQWPLDTLSVLEIRLSKLNNNNNNKNKKIEKWIKYRLCDLSYFLDTCSLWRYGSVWCVKSWIWLKLKVKHETMGIIQDNLCHPYILTTTVLSDQRPND